MNHSQQLEPSLGKRTELIRTPNIILYIVYFIVTPPAHSLDRYGNMGCLFGSDLVAALEKLRYSKTYVNPSIR